MQIMPKLTDSGLWNMVVWRAFLYSPTNLKVYKSAYSVFDVAYVINWMDKKKGLIGDVDIAFQP